MPWRNPGNWLLGALQARCVPLDRARRERSLPAAHGIGRNSSRRCPQPFLQPKQSIPDPALYCAERLLQGRGNFRMAQTLKIRHLDRLLLLRSQRSHQSSDTFSAPFLVECALIIRRNNYGWQTIRLILPAALALTFEPKLIQRAVASQRTEPWNERAARRIVEGRVSPELEEDVLDDFFGGGCMLDNSQDQAVHETRVAIVELFKGAHVFF